MRWSYRANFQLQLQLQLASPFSGRVQVLPSFSKLLDGADSGGKLFQLRQGQPDSRSVPMELTRDEIQHIKRLLLMWHLRVIHKWI